MIINKQYLQTYSPPSKSAISFETYKFKVRNLYGVFGACVEWRTSVVYQQMSVSQKTRRGKNQYSMTFQTPIASTDAYKDMIEAEGEVGYP